MNNDVFTLLLLNLWDIAMNNNIMSTLPWIRAI